MTRSDNPRLMETLKMQPAALIRERFLAASRSHLLDATRNDEYGRAEAHQCALDGPHDTLAPTGKSEE